MNTGAILDDIDYYVGTTPDRIVLIDAERTISYAQLNSWTDAIACFLETKNSVPGSAVAYLGANGIDLIAAFIASLKCGMTFLPVNLSYPADLIDEICQRCNVGVRITDSAMESSASCAPLVFPNIKLGLRSGVKFVRPKIDGTTIALLQCSSGSTNKPKLIPYSHNMLEASCSMYCAELKLNGDDVLAHVGTFWLDFILATLTTGAKISCFDPSHESITEISERLISQNVTHLPVYPALLRLFEKVETKHPSLKVVSLDGELTTRREVEIFERITGQGATLWNCYSSMEATWISIYSHQHGDRMPGRQLPAGTPIGGQDISIISEHGDPLPIGQTGEITIGSPYLPHGYVDDDELSLQSFQIGVDGDIVYSTGDIGYFDVQGTLHVLGRKHEQIRIGGFNVRSAVVESEILRHPQISDCGVVICHDHRGIPYLHAHYVGDSNSAELKAFLSRGLPSFMVPRRLSKVEVLLKTATGKVMRAELQSMSNEPDVTGEQELLGAERSLRRIWGGYLGSGAVSISDNFFDLGGDSLSAIEMLLEVEQVFDRRLALHQFILCGATILGLADLIDLKEQTDLPVLKEGRGARKIYMVHSYYGDLSDYLDLVAAFDADTKVLGINANYPNYRQSMTPIEKAIEAVRLLPHEDERVLIGYSYAGSVALEIARITPLTKTRLILIDPYSTMLRRFRKTRYIWRKFRNLIINTKSANQVMPRLAEVLYEPDYLDIDHVALFYGAEFSPLALAKWKTLFSCRVDTYRQAGDHITMMHIGDTIHMADEICFWLDHNSEESCNVPKL